MAACPSSSIPCEDGDMEREQAFKKDLEAQCLVPFLKIDDPVAVAEVFYSVHNVINKNNYEGVREEEKRSGKEEAKRNLFAILTNRPNWFELLIQALEHEHVACPHVAQELREVKEKLQKKYQENYASSASNVGIPNSAENFDCVDGGELYHDCTSSDSSIKCTPGNGYESFTSMKSDHEYQRLSELGVPRPSDSSSTSAQSHPDGALGSHQEGVKFRPRPGPAEKGRSQSVKERSPRHPEHHRHRHSEVPRNLQGETVPNLKATCIGDHFPQQHSPLQDGPRSCPVPGTSGNLSQRTQEFFPSNDSFSDVSDLPGWAAEEHVTEAEEWLKRKPKGSYFFYGQGSGRLTLAVMSQDGVEQFEQESSRTCGLGKFQLQGQDQAQPSRRKLLEWHQRNGVRTSTRSLLGLKRPWKPPKA